MHSTCSAVCIGFVICYNTVLTLHMVVYGHIRYVVNIHVHGQLSAVHVS